MKRYIMFLVRRKLGLKKYEKFQFANQKTPAVYYFTENAVMKDTCGWVCKSGVSLNWLLDDNCEIRRVKDGEN